MNQRHRKGLLLALLALAGAAPPVSFVPADPRFAAATDDYRRICEAEGARIVTALEAATWMTFPQTPIEMIVHQGAPMTAYDGRTIRLRAGYSPAYKRATLVHELGHRLSFLLPRTAELDDHRLLYVFLYDGGRRPDGRRPSAAQRPGGGSWGR